MADETWADTLRAIDQGLGEALKALYESPNASDLRPELGNRLSEIRSRCETLFHRLVWEPTGRLTSGLPLSREQYHLLAAQGCTWADNKMVGLSPYTDFEVAEFFDYEDEERSCRIDPALPLPPGQIKLKFGVSPEKLRFNALRPEQRRFFEEHLPEVAARFAREAPTPPSDRGAE
ncbi:MAG TPA: hypothetical protein VGK32_12645 [Vicinamibacterales bacterium]